MTAAHALSADGLATYMAEYTAAEAAFKEGLRAADPEILPEAVAEAWAHSNICKTLLERPEAPVAARIGAMILAAENAFGLLWHYSVDRLLLTGRLVGDARQMLSEVLTAAEQQRGIKHARRAIASKGDGPR